MKELRQVPYASTSIYRQGDVWDEEHAPRVLWIDNQGNEVEVDPRKTQGNTTFTGLNLEGITFALGGLTQAQKGRQKRNTYLPGAWANTAPDLIEPGQDAFPLPSSTPTIDPFITESRLATDTSREALRNFMQDYYEGNQRLDQERFNQRPEYFKSLGKSEKVNPLDQLSIFDYNKLVKSNPKLEKELKDQGYFINKNKERGFVELYSINEVQQDLLNSSLKEGLTIDNAIKNLEQRGYGSSKEIKKQLGEQYVNQVETAVQQHHAFDPNYIPPYRTGTYAPGVSTDFGKVDTSVNLRDKWKDNDIITLARDKDFIDSFDINNFDSSSPNARNDEKWNSQIVAKLRSGEWGWKPKTNELVKLSKSEAYKPLSTGRKSLPENLISQTKAPATGNPFTQMGISAFWDEQEALSKRAKDYNKLGEDEWRQKYAPTFQQMQERFQEGKTPIEISDVDAWRPKKMLKDNQFYQYGFEQPTGVDPITGETITKTVSPEEYAGQTVYMSPEESERYNKQMIGDNVENFMRSPIFYLPGAIATGALLGPGGLGRAALNYAPIRSLPGLNLGNALNAEFAYQAFKNDGFAEQAYDAALKGDRGEALKNLGLTGLAAQPYARGARSLYNIGKGLSTPGTAQTIATNLPFSAAYKSPIGSGLALQNPTWSSATKEILPGLTSRFNKTLGSTLGELKLYGTGTQPTVKNPNLLTGSTSAVNQIPGGRYSELPTGRKEYSFPPDVEIPEHRLIKYAQEASGDKTSPLFNPYIKANYTGLDFGDAEFQPFSPGWQAQQEMSNLATYGKQPLLKPSDFATERQMEIDELFYKNRQGIDPDSKDFSAFMKEAKEKGFTPDEVLNRIVTRLGNKVDPARQSQRDLLDQLKPFNLDTRNRDVIRQGNYRPFSKELNEFGSMGGKPAISFGTSGEYDQYYWDQIKRNEDFLTGDYNLSPEQREKIQSKLNSLYQKGVKQGTQLYGGLGFDLKNPMKYTGYDAMRTLSPNQYGGELLEAQFGLTKYLAPAARTLSKYITPSVSQLGKYLTTQTPKQSLNLDLDSLSDFNMGNSDLLDDFLHSGSQSFKPLRSASDVAHKMKAKELDLGLSAWSPENAKNNVQDPLSAGMYFFVGPTLEKTSKLLNKVLPSSFDTDTRNTITSHMSERLGKQFPNTLINPYEPIPLFDSNTTYHLGNKYGVDWNRFAKNYIPLHNRKVIDNNVSKRENEIWNKEKGWARTNNLEQIWDGTTGKHIYIDNTNTQIIPPQFEPDTPYLSNPWNKQENSNFQDGGMYLELDDNEIQNYIDQGYSVDILPQQQVGGLTKALKTVSKLDDLLLPKQLSLFTDADFLRSGISPNIRNMSGFTMPQIENRLLPEYKNLTEEAFKNSVFSPSGKLHSAPQYSRADLYNVFSNPKPQYSMPLNEYVGEFNSRLDILNDIIERNNMSGIPYEVTELTDDGFLRFNSPKGRSSFATRIQPGSFTRENLEEVIDPVYWRNIPGIEMSDTSYGVFGEIANPPRGTNSYRSLNEYLKQQQLGRIKSGFNAQSEAGLKAWEKFIKNNEAQGYFEDPSRMYGIFKKEGGKL
jgi:hypothetical protein